MSDPGNTGGLVPPMKDTKAARAGAEVLGITAEEFADKFSSYLRSFSDVVTDDEGYPIEDYDKAILQLRNVLKEKGIKQLNAKNAFLVGSALGWAFLEYLTRSLKPKPQEEYNMHGPKETEETTEQQIEVPARDDFSPVGESEDVWVGEKPTLRTRFDGSPEDEEGLIELLKPLSERKVIQRVTKATGIPTAKFADDFMASFRSFADAVEPLHDSLYNIHNRMEEALHRANVRGMSSEEAFAYGLSLGYVYKAATDMRVLESA